MQTPKEKAISNKSVAPTNASFASNSPPRGARAPSLIHSLRIYLQIHLSFLEQVEMQSEAQKRRLVNSLQVSKKSMDAM